MRCRSRGCRVNLWVYAGSLCEVVLVNDVQVLVIDVQARVVNQHVDLEIDQDRSDQLNHRNELDYHVNTVAAVIWPVATRGRGAGRSAARAEILLYLSRGTHTYAYMHVQVSQSESPKSS